MEINHRLALDRVRLHAGALLALQEIHAGVRFPGALAVAASSANTPRAVEIGRACLRLLEVVPGYAISYLFVSWGYTCKSTRSSFVEKASLPMCCADTLWQGYRLGCVEFWAHSGG